MNTRFSTVFFIFFIGSFIILSIITPDNNISEMENKILQSLPDFSINGVFDKSYMTELEDYTSDQFPYRTNFISIKNSYEFILGKREFKNIITSSGRLFENKEISNETLDNNISIINDLASYIGNSKVIAIPTSIGLYSSSDLPKYMYVSPQKDILTSLESKFTTDYYNAYNILNKHRDEYIYFNTDHHWTQLGAYYTFCDIYNKVPSLKSTPVSNNFMGTYYSKTLLPYIKPDTINAYLDANDYDMSYDLSKSTKSLYDYAKLKTKNKYQFFLHGDPGIATITGEGSGEVLVLKDSYAHAFVPFLATEYSKVHIIDPRYYNTSIKEYILENPNISELLFIHNLITLGTDSIYKKHHLI